jgi:hypothetical protein
MRISVHRPRKIITRIKGGLGNQLFCYAASRRLALINGAELVIDDFTGFARDYRYHRQYALDHFHIPARKATQAERLEPFERYRRGLIKWLSQRKAFAQRQYLEQEGIDFDERLLTLKVDGTLYMDGYWQGEGYFKDVEQIIREDLRIIPPEDALNLRRAEEIRNSNSVGLHVRWFDPPGSAAIHNVCAEYYERAIALMEERIKLPRYFLFSDDIEAARSRLILPNKRVTYIAHNRGDENAYADLWLMTLCQHFIIANSTFSWWGAWLGGGQEKIIVSPNMRLAGDTITAWGFRGQNPNSWLKI